MPSARLAIARLSVFALGVVEGGESMIWPASSSFKTATIKCASSQVRAKRGSALGRRSIPPKVFSRLKLSSTCQRARYISTTRAGGASAADSDVSSIR